MRAGGDRARSVVQRMCRYSANMTVSPPYWHARQQELQAISATKGCAKLFFTLSAVDNRCEDSHRFMPPRCDDSEAGRQASVIDNPDIVDSYFGTRVDHFISAFFEGVFNAEWKWFSARVPGQGEHTYTWLREARQRSWLD